MFNFVGFMAFIMNQTSMSNNLEIISSKIFTSQSDPKLAQQLSLWHQGNKRLVFTNGCFDILHAGHVDYLSRAAELGEKLIVGLNTDASVTRLKGANRPVNSQYARSQLLAALFFVDAVVWFDDDTPYNLIKTIQPSILVKGGDYNESEIVGSDLVKANNGKVVVMNLVEGYSTSELIRKLTI